MKGAAKLREKFQKWLKEYEASIEKKAERKKNFFTLSNIPLKPLYTLLDLPNADSPSFWENLEFPGEYPYVRGIYPAMYRNRLWTKRLLSGFGAPETFNERVKTLLELGETGINVPAPSVSMRGYDTDQMAEELDKGYIGLYGTPIDSLEDSELSFKDIPIDDVSVNYSDPGPFVSIAMHFAQAKKRGIPWSQVRGTTNQADCLSHWVSTHMFILFPLEVHVKLTIDHLKWCMSNAPKWHPLSIVGQHHSQSGATPLQELAFTLATGIFYVDECIKAGLNVDDFAPRISAFFDGQINLFEQVAKLRASRRMWAKIMKERFNAKDPRSLQLPIHVQTSGVELTRQQPQLNIARVAIQALGAILGGAQSLHTDSYDEAITIPTKEAALLALMTQHVISEESGISDVIDPLGGSYFVESLTDEMEMRAWEYIEKIDSMGGMLEAIKKGFIHQEINRSLHQHQKAIEEKEKIVVGVNEYTLPEEEEYSFSSKVDPELIDRQIERTKRIRKQRDQLKARASLDELRKVAEGSQDGSIFDVTIKATEAYCTRGEIVRVLREVWGYGRPDIRI